MRFLGTTLLLVLLSFFLQEFVPAFEWAFYARLLLVHTVFYTVAVAVPFPVMLILAMVAGFLWDARYHIPVSQGGDVVVAVFSQSELPFGFTMVIFGIMGMIIQGVRPLFRRGRWELPILMIALCTAGGQLIEYLLICFHRGGLLFPAEFWWKILLTALFSALISPFLLLLLSRVATLVRYRLKVEGFKRRYTYDGDSL